MSKGIDKAALDALDIGQLEALQKEIAARAVDKTVERLAGLRKAHVELMAKIERAVSIYGLTARGFLSAEDKDVAEYLRDRVARDVPDLKARPAAGKRARRQSGRGIVAPKYRHPTIKRLTWTGRGHQPDWITKWLGEDKSRTLKQLRAI